MRPSFRPAISGAAIIALAAGVVSLPAAAQAANTNLAIDCNTPYSSQTFYVPSGDDTFTFSLTGFDTVYDYDTGTDIAPLDPTGDTYVVTEGQDLSFYDQTNACSDYFDISVELAGPETVPTGQLLSTQDISVPINPGEITVTESEDDEHFLGGIPTCGISTEVNGKHVYGTLDVTVLTSGDFTFRGLFSNPAGEYQPLQPYDPIGDPFLAVYETFDPAQPDTGVVGCNDDLNDVGASNDAELLSDGSILEGHQPYFSARLERGRYTLVLMTWEDLDAANFALGYGPLAEEPFTVGPKSTNFQLWGPADSLVVGDVIAPAITSPAPSGTASVGMPFRYTVTASGTAPLTYTISSGALPPGLTLDPATGVIEGTPTVGGTFSFTVSVTNAGGTVSAAYAIATTGGAAPEVVPGGIRLPIVSG